LLEADVKTNQLVVLSFIAIGGLWCEPADAQTGSSVAEGLSALLTEQTPPPPGYVRDAAAAQATFATVASLFTIELTSLPTASSSGGFVYRFSRSLGTVERASDSFGPLFTERSLRNGKRQLSVGFTYQFAKYKTLQGADLTAGTFPTNTARFSNALQPFSVDTLALELDVDSATGFVSYGITDRLDVGVIAPVTRLHFSGSRVNTFNGVSTLQSVQARSATGLGDITINGRYRLTGDSGTGVAVGTDLRLPTGGDENLLGAGRAAWRLLGIGSWERAPFAVDLNGGVGVGGASREQFWSGALTYAATPRVSVVAELMGRRFSDLTRVADVYEPHPVLAGVETMRWLPTGGGLQTVYLVTGAKVNVFGRWLVKANVLTRLTDTGLRAKFTPSIAFDYAREF
jgi:hypothetical protein